MPNWAWMFMLTWALSGALAGIGFLASERELGGPDPSLPMIFAAVVFGALSGPAFWLMASAAYLRDEGKP